MTVIATGFGHQKRHVPEIDIEEALPIPMPTAARRRVAGSSIDMFGTELPSTGPNRIACSATMNESDVLKQPQLSDEEQDNLEVPAFLRKHWSVRLRSADLTTSRIDPEGSWIPRHGRRAERPAALSFREFDEVRG